MTHLSAYIINNKLQTIKKDISEEEITMSKKDGYSSTGLFGNINHYDSNGRKIGEIDYVKSIFYINRNQVLFWK